MVKNNLLQSKLPNLREIQKKITLATGKSIGDIKKQRRMKDTL